MPFIPYGRQSISTADIEAVSDVLRSEFLTQGPAVPAFESAVAGRCGAKFAVAANSATSALHLACLAIGIGPGDRVWTSPVTFVASANCARHCGAEIDFVDIDPITYNMSPEALAEKLERAEREGKLPKLVIPVHLSGQSCDMGPIRKLAGKFGFRVIEDASHAIGGSYRKGPIGDCRYSDIVIFSFHPVKIITTGEGGMALTNDAALAERMKLLRSHGITRDAEQITNEPDGPWYYEQIALGFNYRMTDIQAALGHSQLQNLEAWIVRRRTLAARYSQDLATLPLITPATIDAVQSAWHLYVIKLRDDAPIERNDLFAALRADGLGVNVHYIPVHLQPYYRALGFDIGDFPASEAYYSRAISIPLYAGLTDDQQSYVLEKLTKYCRSA
jgi:UDP-4-amino-4,6-dideoxy-N-acetyl-beta-L-altrosamine transaminase